MNKTNLRMPILFLSCVVLAAAKGSIIIAGTAQDNTLNEHIAMAIKQLWSADDTQRQEGKAKLLLLGPAAIGAVQELLDNVTKEPRPRYATGKEKEGQEAWSRYEWLLKNGAEEEIREALKELSKIIITSRLRDDAIELLGRLRAEESVSSLIEVMISENIMGLREYWTPAMQSLVEIGSKAVPKLIEAIETAEIRAASVRFSGQQPTEEQRREFIRIETYKIQARAAMVLGRIGDRRALPILEKLLKATTDRFLAPYVRKALENIKAR